MRNLYAIALATTLLMGCELFSQNVNLNPTITTSQPTTTTQSTEGRGVTVLVRVVDERPSKSLGRRAGSFGPAAEITSNSDFEQVVAEKVKESLQARGFSVSNSDSSSSATLNVEIRLLQYSTSFGFFTMGTHIQAALKAVATKSGKSYEKMYRSDKEERTVIVPTAGMNEEWINVALSDVLTQLASDRDLIAFLAD